MMIYAVFFVVEQHAYPVEVLLVEVAKPVSNQVQIDVPDLAVENAPIEYD